MSHIAPLMPEQLHEEQPYLGARGRRYVAIFGAVGLVALILSYLIGAVKGDSFAHFYFSYLCAWLFCVSLALGALFFVLLQHLTRASWSVVIRRPAEQLAMTLPWLAVLFLPLLIPILAGDAQLFHWLAPIQSSADPLLAHKAPYLSLPFFTLRLVIYFGCWSLMAWYFRRCSIRQDVSGDPRLSLAQWRASAPAMIVFALTVTFFAVDMVMSLDAHWFSTIIGVYFFSGCVVGFLALITLIAVALQLSGRLKRAITVEHYHDLGKLLFAFVFFWGYIAFSQYMLIWYANIPEETGWYLKRQEDGWLLFSLILLFVHLLIPFAILLSRLVKRRKRLLAPVALWMLIAHYIDVYWLVMPELGAGRVLFSWLDLTCLLAAGGLFAAGAVYLADQAALVPLKDPGLADSLRFENM